MAVPVMIRPPRPTGVTILTILQIIIGVIDILIGVLLLALYALAGALLGFAGFAFSGDLLVFLALGLVLIIFGVFSFALAYGLWTGREWAWISSIIVAIIGVAIGALGLVFGEFSSIGLANLLPIIFYVLILVYLSTRNVRAFFGRIPPLVGPPPIVAAPAMGPPPAAPPPGAAYPVNPPIVQPQYPRGFQPAAAPPMQAPPQPYPPPYQPTYQQPPPPEITTCPSCGSSVVTGANYCDRCGSRLR